MSIRLNSKKKTSTDTLKQIILELRKLQGTDIDVYSLITRMEVTTGSANVRVRNWTVTSNSISNSFILGHSTNGILGSPALSIVGSQILIGSYLSGGAVVSGGTFP